MSWEKRKITIRGGEYFVDVPKWTDMVTVYNAVRDFKKDRLNPAVAAGMDVQKQLQRYLDERLEQSPKCGDCGNEGFWHENKQKVICPVCDNHE